MGAPKRFTDTAACQTKGAPLHPTQAAHGQKCSGCDISAGHYRRTPTYASGPRARGLPRLSREKAEGAELPWPKSPLSADSNRFLREKCDEVKYGYGTYWVASSYHPDPRSGLPAQDAEHCGENASGPGLRSGISAPRVAPSMRMAVSQSLTATQWAGERLCRCSRGAVRSDRECLAAYFETM